MTSESIRYTGRGKEKPLIYPDSKGREEPAHTGTRDNTKKETELIEGDGNYTRIWNPPRAADETKVTGRRERLDNSSDQNRIDYTDVNFVELGEQIYNVHCGETKYCKGRTSCARHRVFYLLGPFFSSLREMVTAIGQTENRPHEKQATHQGDSIDPTY